MFQNSINLALNYDEFSKNESFPKEADFQNLDLNIFPCPYLHLINQNENKIEGESLNDFFLTKKSLLLEGEINKSKQIEKQTKENTNEGKGIKIPFLTNKKQNNFISGNIKENKNQNIDWPKINQLKNNLKPKSNIGRKKKNEDSEGKHNKFADDNLRRKALVLILNNALDFVNGKIKAAYKGNIGQGIMKKELLQINLNNKSNITIEHSKNLLNKTLGEILSQDISTRYTNYFPKFNKKLIERLIKEEDEKKKLYFQKLFNITFLQCIKRLNGADICDELKEFQTFNELKKKNKIKKAEPEYIENLELYLSQFEENIKKKKGRKLRLINQENN